MIHEELSGKIIGAATEEDNLPTKHTKHPKEEKPLALLVCFRVFSGQLFFFL
jgi:hypothetical protein